MYLSIYCWFCVQVPATDDAYLDTTNDSLPLKNSLKKKGYLIEKLNENNSDVTQEFSDTSSNYDRKVLQKRKVARWVTIQYISS